jgi:methyltransferase (TIGR00027 family)
MMFNDGPANTALLTAAARASENERPDPLVRDPYARVLAGEEGKKLLESYGMSFVLLETIRTKFIDDAVMDAVRGGKKQFVVLGAGLDARPYRFRLPSDVSWFEIDFGSILEYKRSILKGEKPSVTPVDVGMDVTRLDLRRDLVTRGFDPRRESVWVAEGLLPYLRDEQVEKLLDLVSEASAPGSLLLLTCPNKQLIRNNSETTDRQRLLKGLGAQYVYSGTDEPAELLRRHGYGADAVFMGHRRAHFGLLPMVPLETAPAGFPTEWFVIGTRH